MNKLESEYSKRCKDECRKPVDQTMFKARGHVERGQIWTNKKTGETVKIDSVRMLGACYISFYMDGRLKMLARGKFLKWYKKGELNNATN